MALNYKGFKIETKKESHTSLIYKGTKLVKCIAGDIFTDGSTNAIEKAKKYISTINNNKPI